MLFPKNNNRLAIFFNLNVLLSCWFFFFDLLCWPHSLDVLQKKTPTCIAKGSLRILNVFKTTCKVFLTQYLNGVYCSF